MTVSRVIGAVLAVAMTFGISWLSRAPVTLGDESDGLIRLSWRVDGVTVEACRELSPEEVADLPVHMRNPNACIGQIAPFVLRASVDGRAMVHDTISPGGARGDRPIYVLRDIPMSAGQYRLAVHFEAIVPEGATVGDATTSYSWEQNIEIEPGAVALLTLDDFGAFVLRHPDG